MMIAAIEPSTSIDPSIMKNGRVLFSAIEVPCMRWGGVKSGEKTTFSFEYQTFTDCNESLTTACTHHPRTVMVRFCDQHV